MTFLSRTQTPSIPVVPRRPPAPPTQEPANRPAQRPAPGHTADVFEVRGRAGPQAAGGAAGGVKGLHGGLGVSGGVEGVVAPEVRASGGASAEPPGVLEQLQETARQNLPGYAWLESKVDGTLKALSNAKPEVLDAKKQIESMKPGDKYSLSGGFDGGIKLGRLNTKAQYEVSCDAEEKTDPKTGATQKKPVYTLSMDAEVLGGIGTSKLKGLELKALGGGGGKVEYKLDTPEDVARAQDIMGRVQSGAECNIAGTPRPPPSQEDMDWLQSKMSAMEVRGASVAQLTTELDLKGTLVDSAGADVKGRGEKSLRIEFKDGKPSELVLKENLQVELSGSLSKGLGTKGTVTGPDNMKLPFEGGVSLGGTGKVNGKVEMETRFPIPSGVTVDKLLEDPRGTLGSAKEQMGAGKKSKVTLSLDGAGTYQGNGVGMAVEVSIEGNSRKLQESGALERLLTGDVPGSLKAAGKDAEVSLKATPYSQKGISLAPEIKVGPYFDASWELEVSRRTALVPPMEKKGTAADLAQWLEENSARKAA
ncbi:hypothetical protein OV207_25450 [Corallococcus sp. BB11-1]|uniref:hypothetical protein n=1 Tax=Corallococcus sp. BB11-1 TaxID=2996783 RepID=UPI00226EB1CC|nr:hypothetical protein [Corallococcus sp. BB11-1]MCY1034819.1 hypothetical protein [Corallococcus sp. BB11-1]